MSRSVESKIPELDGRIENIERQNRYLENELRNLRRTDDVITELRIIELAWQDKCECGVAAINRHLEDGFEIYKQFQTESGVVVELARWGIK